MDRAEASIYLLLTSKWIQRFCFVNAAVEAELLLIASIRGCAEITSVCERVSRTQVVVEEVEEHQHAAAHDHKHADHDGGDVHRLFILLLCGLVPLQLEVAPGGKPKAVSLVNPRSQSPAIALLLLNGGGGSPLEVGGLPDQTNTPPCTSGIYRQLLSWLASLHFSLQFKRHTPAPPPTRKCFPPAVACVTDAI